MLNPPSKEAKLQITTHAIATQYSMASSQLFHTARASLASQDSSTFTISDISQSRLVAPAASVSSRLPAPLFPHQPLLRPPRQFLVVLGNLKHHALGLGIGHLPRVGARFLSAFPPVRGIIEATVGHDTPYAAVRFAPVRIHPSMARCLRLACEAERDPAGESLCALGRGRNARIRLPRWIYAIRTDVQRTETSNRRNLRNSHFGPVAQLDRAAVS